MYRVFRTFFNLHCNHCTQRYLYTVIQYLLQPIHRLHIAARDLQSSQQIIVCVQLFSLVGHFLIDHDQPTVLLAREGWQNNENSWKKINFSLGSCIFVNLQKRCPIILTRSASIVHMSSSGRENEKSVLQY